MKKFFLCFFILLCFSGFVFFVGWTQFKVKPNEIGIVVSKLGGVNKTPIVNGKFSFNPEFLIPTNAELHVFSLKPYTATKTFSGELPNAETSNPFNFKYSFVFSYESHITPESVVSLLEKSMVSDSEDLEKYQERLSDAVIQDSVAFYLKKASQDPGFIPESVTIVDLFKSCNFPEKYPDIEIDVLALTSVELPDYEYYRFLRKARGEQPAETNQIKAD